MLVLKKLQKIRNAVFFKRLSLGCIFLSCNCTSAISTLYTHGQITIIHTVQCPFQQLPFVQSQSPDVLALYSFLNSEHLSFREE